MTEIEQRALDAIDIDAMLACLGELVATRSLDGEENAVQRKVAAILEQIGFDVDVWDIDFETVRQHPAYCEEVIREEGLGDKHGGWHDVIWWVLRLQEPAQNPTPPQSIHNLTGTAAFADALQSGLAYLR